MKKCNKLVRDKIPTLIQEKGEDVIWHVASEEEYRKKLFAKLMEEVHEYIQDESYEELVDILEVVYAIADAHNIDATTLEKLRMQKKEDRGGFTKKIILDCSTKQH